MDNRFGHQPLQRTAVSHPGTQIRARHLEAGNLDLLCLPTLRDGRCRCSRSIHHDQDGEVAQLVGTLPGVQQMCGVASHDQVQLGVRFPEVKLCERFGGVGWAASIDLDAARLQAGNIGNRCLDHRKAIQSRADRKAGLLPGVVRNDKKNPIETELMQDIDGRDEMPDMGRIERPAEYTKTFHRNPFS